LFPLVTGLNHPLFDQLNPFKWHFAQTKPIGFYDFESDVEGNLVRNVLVGYIGNIVLLGLFGGWFGLH